jgi:nucleoside-diphosphate-sugar epimerase
MAARTRIKQGLLQTLVHQLCHSSSYYSASVVARSGASASRVSSAAAAAPASSSASSTLGSSIQSEETVVEAAEAAEPKAALERSKILVLGGNGFVGTHACQEALSRHLPVVSMSRSGRPAATVHDDPWINNVTWVRGDIFHPERWKDTIPLEEVSAVISCVGGFGSDEQMLKINGEANIAAINAASKSGVKRFVFISALDYGLPSFVLRGYYKGKKSAEEELLRKFPYGGVILRPGFIHGNRQVGSLNIPLSAIGAPLEMLLKNAKPASRLPLVGNFLMPPVKVTSVARAAVRSAIDNAVPPGVLDVWSIKRLGDH